MGVKELILLLLVLHCLCSPASFVPDGIPDGKNFVSESTHKKMEGNQIDKSNCTIDGSSVIVNQSKYISALAGGKHGGRSVGNGGNGGGNEGQTTSSPQNGGNGEIPVYAAGGASGQRRNEKGDAAICSYKEGFAELMVTTLVSLLLHYIPM
ncbi:uncharacterized protein [Rutidosis leptorrhynchoides]|uniref:uncharacterized protein n=1 Tax=Rutidosis leptorrhynchoides TaxID=125765 RepID=UPI003A9A638F